MTLQRLGQRRDREERAREQEQRGDPEPPDRVERGGVPLGGHVRGDRARERERGQGPDGHDQHDARRRGGAEQHDDQHEDAAHQRARVAIQARRPAAIEYGEIGVAYIAWNRRIQWNPARTGNVASNTEPCMTTTRAGPAPATGGRTRRQALRRHCRHRRRPRGRSPWPPGTAPAGRSCRRSSRARSGRRAATGARRRRVHSRATSGGAGPLRSGPVRAEPRRRPSVHQAAAGQPEEHVLQRAPPDQDGLRQETTLVDGDRDRLTVVGVHEDPVGEELDALAETIQPALEGLLDTDGKRISVTSRVAYSSMSCAASPRQRSGPCP